jgi:hypothetical protein
MENRLEVKRDRANAVDVTKFYSYTTHYAALSVK